MRGNRIELGAILLCAAGLIGLGIADYRHQQQRDAYATRIERFCSFAEATLRRDVSELRRERESPRRAEIVRRVFTTESEGDGEYSLTLCLPEPFPIDQWTRCATENDNACLARMLENVATSLSGAR